MLLAVPKESKEGEQRVALTPSVVQILKKLGHEVWIEEGAASKAGISDQQYAQVGATVVCKSKIWQESSTILKVNPPSLSEVNLLKQGSTLIGLIWPSQNKEILDALCKKKSTVIAMDCVPRISRAQKLDVLSSMANIAGYRAVIECSHEFGRFFMGQITAAGKVPPAKVLVIGAGVAGLSAIGCAKGLGAIVKAFDTREEVRDQVISMGGEFLTVSVKESGEGQGGYAKVMSKEFIAAEMALFTQQAKEVDIIITTALIPGKKAPLLLTEEMVASMGEGSVICDLAAEQGGNCALTENGKVIRKFGVTIIGYNDLPSRLPLQASELYGNNLKNLLADLSKEGELVLDLEDEVVRGCTVIHQGELIWPPPKPKEVTVAKKSADTPPATVEPKNLSPKGISKGKRRSWAPWVALAAAVWMLIWLGQHAPAEFLSHLTVFVLACFVGWQVVWNVTPALHTPLMSVTNAISGIIVVGAILSVAGGHGIFSTVLSAVALTVGMINVVGGFWVTQRMLAMFKK